MKRFNPDIKKGLSTEEVNERIQEGLVNFDDQPKTKSIKKIIASNFFTYFNFLNLALGLAVFLSGLFHGELFHGLKNCLFMGVIIINSIISMIEEIISKKIIDRLSLLSESEITVLRNGEEVKLKLEEIVLDDIVLLHTGHQVIADSIVLDGVVEVNESLLTGEVEPIIKKKGDLLLSGSFLVSGNCTAKVEHIGSENYVSLISKEAKYDKKVNSIIMDSFEKLLKVLSILIIPIGIFMFLSQYSVTDGNITESVFTTVAALIGMIPEGLVLLTSSVMAVSVIRLSRYKVLVQQLYCIETLARVDVICLDKTGTLTEGKMKVVDVIPYQKNTTKNLENILSLYSKYTKDVNATMKAFQDYFQNDVCDEVKDIISFSSERKFSAIEFQEEGCIYIGAPEFLLGNQVKVIENLLSRYQEEYRVLVVAKGKKLNKTPENLTVLGLVLLEDVIRKEAKDTLHYFQSQGVVVKIISGDQVKTVLNIAKKVGLSKVNGIDVGNLTNEELAKATLEYQVFGRVKPDQKKVIIETLQKNGRTVAMTGDGVNDVLALKKSDCAISLASGSDAARNVSQLVLLDDNFDSLPMIVEEGRRTINNIERSASLLTVKTIYTMLLILFSIAVATKYFFIPIQLTLITTFTIGTPSFILALEPNHDLVRGNFLLKVISRSLPVALTIFFNVVLVTIFSRVFSIPYEMQSSISVFLTAITGFIYLYKICTPFTWLRRVLFTVLFIGFFYCVFFQYSFFNLTPIAPQSVLIAFVLCIDSLYVYKKLNHYSTLLFSKFDPTIDVEY